MSPKKARWRARDPLITFERVLLGEGLVTAAELAHLPVDAGDASTSETGGDTATDHATPDTANDTVESITFRIADEVAQATERVGLMTYVTCPTMRYHPAVVAQTRATYFGMMSEVDAQIGRLFDGIRDRCAWDDTLVILTSDHGEQLGDHWLSEKLGWFGDLALAPAASVRISTCGESGSPGRGRA